MLEALTPSSFRGPIDRFVLTVLTVLLAATTLGVVALLAVGRLGVIDATFLALLPWVLLAAAFRPDWLLLGFIAMPATVTADLPKTRVLALVGAAFVMLLVTRRTFSLGWGTALATLLIINVAGYLFQAHVGPDAIALNRATMLTLTLDILLALLAFNLALLGELHAGHLATAFVIGVVTTLVVGVAGYGGAWFENGLEIITKTYLGMMAAGAFGVSLARLLMAEVPGRRLGNLLMTGILLALTIASLSRAPWLAAAITFGILAFRLGKRGYGLIVIVAIVGILLVPAVRQQIARSESGDIVAEVRSGEITTGRWKLWTALWERAQPALPWGHGFGYMWSLSSEDIFEQRGQFQHEESGFVPPHNDFVYLLVEFGLPGLLLLIVFWVGLFRAPSLLGRSTDPYLRRSGWLFFGVLVAGLTFATFDDLFAVRPIAERFFPVAGFVFGLAEVERARRREHSALRSVSMGNEVPPARLP